MNQEELFSNKALRNLIVPIFLEQLLVMLVGLADTFIASYVGESAVSGVSLVNQFNNVFIYLFTALASGGSVIINQYIGKKALDDAGESASQLLLISIILSIFVSILVIKENKMILRLMFGGVEKDVMESCITYLKISAYSYPMLAIFEVGVAFLRSMKKTNITMLISVISNVINVVGNLIGVFILKAGVAGVAWPSFIARLFSAILITIICFQKKNQSIYKWEWIFSWNKKKVRSILKIAIPNGLENGLFQLVKVALSSIVALFGTYQIAANGVAQSIWSLAALAGVTMGPVFTVVIGQCIGKGDNEATKFYFDKLIKITLVLSISWNLIILLFISTNSDRCVR